MATTQGNKDRFERLHKLRKKAKVVNYSSLYGVGAPKLAREMGVTRKEAKELLDAFWELNWAIRKVSEQQFTKEVGGYTWVKNPVSGFWYELRYSKDTWSTINQGTGVFIFDSWLARARLKGYNGQAQFHDETLTSVTNESRSREALKYGVEKLNQDLKLHVSFGIDTKVGESYSDVH